MAKFANVVCERPLSAVESGEGSFYAVDICMSAVAGSVRRSGGRAAPVCADADTPVTTTVPTVPTVPGFLVLKTTRITVLARRNCPTMHKSYNV